MFRFSSFYLTALIFTQFGPIIFGQQQQQNLSCWDFMSTIPRIRQFTARVALAPSVQRKLQLGEFKFTVFAYTNEAYLQAIGDGFDEQLSQSDTIKYHIYGAGIDSSNRIELADFYWRDIDQTLLSQPVFASQMVESDPTEQYETLYYYVNGARVVESWTNSSSCYVYAIDRVLLPIAKPQSIYGFLQSAENNLSMLNDLIDVVAASDPSILSTLKQLRIGTAFLPTDEAFAKLEPGEFDRIKANPGDARKTLLAHFSFSSSYFTGKLKAGTLYPMEYSVIQGVPFAAREACHVYYNGVRVKLTHSDIALSNGVVHFVDSVLTPPNDDLAVALGKLENLSKFSSLIASDGDVRELLTSSTRYTIFAPIDAAVGDVSRFRTGAAETLDPLLKGLIVRGQFATSNLKQLVSVDEMVLPFASFLTTVAGTRLNIIKIHNDLFISDGSSMARIIRGYSDIAAANGIVHYVDAFVGRPSRGVFDTISSFGSNLNSTANSLRQLGFSDALGVSSANTKSGQKSAKKWWVMFVPIESSWGTLRKKKGANALLRNRMAMSRVWHRHIFYSEQVTFSSGDDDDGGYEIDSGFIRPGNLTTINDLLETEQKNDGNIEQKLSVVETGRNNYQLQAGDERYKIMFSNIGCSNGVVHIIDRLMLVDDDAVAELNIGNPRVIGAHLRVGNDNFAENASHLSVAYDDYGSTVDAFAPLGPVDLTRADSASITFAVDCGDFHNISNLGSQNVAPLPAFSFVVPELDVQFPNVFTRNATNLENTNKKHYQYAFTKRQLAEAGICDVGVNPVASALPGHHQGRAYMNFSFHFGPVILSITANVSARGCLFTCNVVTCPANRPIRVLWAFTTDDISASDDSNDEAFALGNVASNGRQFYLDTVSCGRMVSSVTSDPTLQRSLKISCRASDVSNSNDEWRRTFTTQTVNFFEVVTNARSH